MEGEVCKGTTDLHSLASGVLSYTAVRNSLHKTKKKWFILKKFYIFLRNIMSTNKNIFLKIETYLKHGHVCHSNVQQLNKNLIFPQDSLKDFLLSREIFVNSN